MSTPRQSEREAILTQIALYGQAISLGDLDEATRIYDELSASLRREEQGEAKKQPSVPEYVLTCIHAYGDARADDDGTSAVRLMEVIKELRRWGAALQSNGEQQ